MGGMTDSGGMGSGGMGSGMTDSGGMGSGGMGSMTASLAGDVAYPLHVNNGRAPSERDTISAVTGQRVRLIANPRGTRTASMARSIRTQHP